MHPIEIALAAKADPALLLPNIEKRRIVRPRNARTATPPTQRIMHRIEIDRDPPAMHRHSPAAAHLADIEATAEQIEPEITNCLHPIMIMDSAKSPERAVMGFFMDRKASDNRACIPGQTHRKRQIELGLMMARLAIKSTHIFLPRKECGLVSNIRGPQLDAALPVLPMLKRDAGLGTSETVDGSGLNARIRHNPLLERDPAARIDPIRNRIAFADQVQPRGTARRGSIMPVDGCEIDTLGGKRTLEGSIINHGYAP